MMNSRKQIVAQITVMDRLLKHEKIEVRKNQTYLVNTITDHRLVFIATILPAILWGWKLGKEKKVSVIIKNILKFGFLNLFTQVRKHFMAHTK